MTPIAWPTPTPLPPGGMPPFIDLAFAGEGSPLNVDAMENAVQIYNKMSSLTEAIMTFTLVLIVLAGFYLVYQLLTSEEE